MKILAIEDDRRVAEAIAEALADQKYETDIAADGQEGLDLAQSFSYDLIILDLVLPKLDGISVCQQLRKSGDQTLILMLTSKDTSESQVLGLDAGADDYVVKPFEVNTLLARVRALLRRKSTTANSQMGKAGVRSEQMRGKISQPAIAANSQRICFTRIITAQQSSEHEPQYNYR